jgi:hypothetical protein
MNIDKNLLKQTIQLTHINNLFVVNVNSLEKDSYRKALKELDRFITKNEDFVITVIKK